MKTLVTIVALVAATTANAGTTIKNIIDTETNLLIGQTWTDNESGSTDYVYVDKTDRQLFVVNQDRYKELVKNVKYGPESTIARVHMGEQAGDMDMSLEMFTGTYGSIAEAEEAWHEMLHPNSTEAEAQTHDPHSVELITTREVKKNSKMKLTPRMVKKLNAKIKQYNESE